MMRSLFSGVAGLKGHQTRMDVIGNNIANVNTTGFKSSRVTFADTLNQTTSGASAPGDNIGGTNPKQIGLGVGVASIDLLFTDGSVQSTGKNTDLCLSGNGLFVVKQGNETYYTRDGAFEFDAEGNYVLPGSGLKVQGWMADANGELNTSGDVTNIVVSAGKSMGPEPTSKATYSNNINAATLVIKSISGGKDSSTVTLSDGRTVNVRAGQYNVGDVYETKTESKTYNNAGATITVSQKVSPVQVTMKDGSTHQFDYTSTDTDWSYGYKLTNSGDKIKAESPQKVTLYGANNRSVDAIEGETYTVGGMSAKKIYGNSGDEVTVNSGEKVILTLADGSEHDVSNQPNTSYIVGTSTYTYPAGGSSTTSTVASISVQFPITSIDVASPEGDGAVLSVGGFALHNVASGEEVTASTDNEVIIKLANGDTVTKTTGSYKVGASYEGNMITTAGATVKPTTANQIKLTLENGTTIVDKGTTGLTYTIGDNYTYTEDSVDQTTGQPVTNVVTSAITGYQVLTTIKSLQERKDITQLDTTEITDITVTEVNNGAVEASSDNAVVLTMSDGTTQTMTVGKYLVGQSLPVTTIINVYDTLGTVHSVPVYFTKTKVGTGETTSDGNQWTIGVDGSDVAGTTNKIYEDDGSVTTITMNPATLQFSTEGKLLEGSGVIEFTLTDGANRTQTVTLDVSQLTQFTGGSTFNGMTDGNAAGTLKSVSVDSSGVITGTYTNGIKQKEAQVAIAQFNNASGLTKTGSSLYQVSNNSGEPNVKTAADLGCTITPSALEMSNVDIANEFSDMIITQRGFQSNSKIITVGDEMLETLINMKR
ncbi:flagellar hook-basal body complex protein [Selenomonas ruminantium]|uniref:Flagellar hook protein FlgE n=1 Tax=Selenomonas ruminantium TaxID=971 RepID=A0A1H3ZJP6_SELRU|nr:flagellar hook-basal body complex protein [Selenomonas ruminantium]SEA23963.1 Flagella basal body rod protein [Selenomonas ruminantium]